jgi:hypothetical protein
MPRAMHAEINSMLKFLKSYFGKGAELDARLEKIGINPQAILNHFVETATDEEFQKLGMNPKTDRQPRKWLDHATAFEAAISLTAVEARKIFLFLACHDDKQSDYISINTTYNDFLMGCFPGLVEQKKTGKIYIKPENKKLIDKKLEGFTYLCGLLGAQGRLNGAQFLPFVFDTPNKRVKVIRSKNLCYNGQPELNFQD